MIFLTATERFVALATGILVLLGMIIGAKGKWDATNATLGELQRGLASFMMQHEKDHARMDRDLDGVEERLQDHIGRHRRY